MDVRAGLEAPCSADVLFAYVADLSSYPRWLDLVHRADPLPGDDPVWSVDLRARLGPLARSKRLRMVRTVHDPDRWRCTFERRELDHRRHSPWILRIDVDESDGTSALRMHLHYGGALWTGGVLERVLAEQIRSGRERLLHLVQPTR